MGPGCVDVIGGDAHWSEAGGLEDGRGGVGEEDAVPPLWDGAGDIFAVEVGVDEVNGVMGSAEAEVGAGEGEVLREGFVFHVLDGGGRVSCVWLREAETGEDRPEQEDSGVEVTRAEDIGLAVKDGIVFLARAGYGVCAEVVGE